MKKNLLVLFMLLAIIWSGNLKAQTSTLDVAEDTWVSQEEPDANKDGITDMQVSMDTANSKSFETYLKFDLSELEGFVTDAKLRIRGNQKGDGGWTALDKQTVVVYAVYDDAWAEADLTWNTKPAAGKMLAEVDFVDPSGYLTVESAELSEYVNSALLNTDRSSVSFVLKAKENTPGSRVWISDKGWAGAKLDVTSTEISNSITVSDDSWVNEMEPDANYDGETDMNVTMISGNSREAYLRFDLSEVSGMVMDAALMIKGNQQDNDDWTSMENFYVQVFGSNDQDWTEAAITWNTKPDAGSSALDEANITASKWWTFGDPAIANYINYLIKDGKSTVTFIIRGKVETPGARAWFSDKGWAKPTLHLITEEVENALVVTEDTWIGSAAPDANHEGETDMQVYNDSTGGDQRMAVVSFDLSDVPGYMTDEAIITDVSLQLRGDQWTSDDAPDFVKLPHFYIEVMGLSDKGDDAIDETTLTWNNLPDELTANPLATVDFAYGGWYTISSEEINNFVNDAILDRRGTVTFVIRAKEDIANTRVWLSDKGWAKPTLNFSAQVVDEIITVADDSWVGEQEPDANHEGETDIQISNNSGNAREAYLKFPVTEAMTAKNLALRLKGAPVDDDDWTPTDNFWVQVFAAASNDWGEDTLTWNNKPAAETTVLAEANVNYSGWHTLSGAALVEYVNEEVANGADSISLVVKGKNNTPDERIWISDKGWSAPEIAIVGDVPAEAPADPVIAVDGGTYAGPVEVYMSTATEGASIFYTIDGNEPTNASTKYEDPVVISQSATLKAISYLGSTPGENVISAAYTITPGHFIIEVDGDTWVGEAEPETNHDGETDMNITKSEGDERLALLSFDISEVEGYVSTASLHLRGDQQANDDWARIDSLYYEVYAVFDGSWSESEVTWSTKPEIDELLGEKNVQTGGWQIVSTEDLAAYVNKLVNDDDKNSVSFAIRAKENTPGSRLWFSDKGWAKPKLSLTVMALGQKLTVQDDSWVGDVDAYVNHEGETDIQVTKSESDNRMAFVKFDISNSSKASMIALMLRGAQQDNDDWSPQDHFFVDIYGCDDNTWAEAGLIWANKPEFSTEQLAHVDITQSIWHSFPSKEITDYVNARIEAGEQFVTFAIVGHENTPGARAWFSSKEWAAPNLRLYYGGSVDIAQPVFDPAPGLYPPPSLGISLSSATDGAAIYYTTNESVPTEESTLYEGPITLTEEQERMTIRAVAILDGVRSYMTEGTFVVGSQKPYSGTPIVIPGVIEGWKYDLGGEGVAYHEDSPDNLGTCGGDGVSISESRTDGGLIDGCCSDDGCGIGWGANGEWTEYTIKNTGTNCFTALLLYVKAGDAEASIQIDEMDADNNVIQTLVPSTELPQNTDNWGALREDVTLHPLNSKFYLEDGEHIIRITWTGYQWNLRDLEIHPAEGCATGIDMHENGMNNLMLYPNPVNHTLNLDFSSEIASESNIQIVNIAGQTVLTEQIFIQPGKNIKSIDVNGLNEGIYFMVMNSTNERIIRKFIVNK